MYCCILAILIGCHHYQEKNVLGAGENLTEKKNCTDHTAVFVPILSKHVSSSIYLVEYTPFVLCSSKAFPPGFFLSPAIHPTPWNKIRYVYIMYIYHTYECKVSRK